MKGLNNFERSVKDSLESYEVPYNSADWAQLQRSLDQGNGSGRVVRSGLYALLMAGGIATISSVYMLLTPAPTVLSGQADANGDAYRAFSTVSDLAALEVLADNSGPASKDQATHDKRPLVQRSSDAVAKRDVLPTEYPASTGSTGAMVNGTTGENSVPTVRPSITEGCPGTEVDFAVENFPEEGIYLWNFGDGSFSNKPAPRHAFSKAGSFEVMLSHSTPGGGSIHNKPAADRIIIHEAPEASFNLLKQEYDNTVPSVHFENRSIRGNSYNWDFGDGTSSSIAHPDHVYKKAGVFHVQLTVTNPKGCIDRAERTVRIDSDYDLLSAKTFSPNGDGVEDVFIPEALKTLGVKFHFSVFDSSTGALVFETNDPQRPWNGRISNRGEACSTGNFVWMVEMKDGEKMGGNYNGSIELVR